jgi:hypothetical protein
LFVSAMASLLAPTIRASDRNHNCQGRCRVRWQTGCAQFANASAMMVIESGSSDI